MDGTWDHIEQEMIGKMFWISFQFFSFYGTSAHGQTLFILFLSSFMFMCKNSNHVYKLVLFYYVSDDPDIKHIELNRIKDKQNALRIFSRFSLVPFIFSGLCILLKYPEFFRIQMILFVTEVEHFAKSYCCFVFLFFCRNDLCSDFLSFNN